MKAFKNRPPEERFYQFVTGTFNPFRDANFSEEHLDRADNPAFDLDKDIDIPDLTMPPSLMRLYATRPFKDDVQQSVTEHIAYLRS